MTKRTIRIIQITILILIISFTIHNAKAVEKYGVTNINHSPQILQQNENMTVTVEFSYDTNISLVKLLICQLSPEFKCEAQPIVMDEITDNVYSGKFSVRYDNGTQVGYHIIIVYENFTTVTIPETAEFLELDIIEPVTGEFFINAGKVGEEPTPSKTGCLCIIPAGAAMLGIAITIKRRRKKS